MFSPSHFTGKERDTESGNDYFEARYYSSAMGRFMSPDWSAQEEPVPYAKLDNPQSLNLYAYVGNNPLGGVDLDGHQFSGSSNAGANCAAGDIHCLKSSGACGNAICSGPPTLPNGRLAPPKVPLHNGKNGEVNEWVVKDSGNGTRVKWGPKYPVPSADGGQPSASWDDRDGKSGKDHWDVENGKGDRTRVDENGEPVTEAEAHGKSATQKAIDGAYNWARDQWEGYKNYLKTQPGGSNYHPSPVPSWGPIPVWEY